MHSIHGVQRRRDNREANMFHPHLFSEWQTRPTEDARLATKLEGRAGCSEIYRSLNTTSGNVLDVRNLDKSKTFLRRIKLITVTKARMRSDRITNEEEIDRCNHLHSNDVTRTIQRNWLIDKSIDVFFRGQIVHLINRSERSSLGLPMACVWHILIRRENKRNWLKMGVRWLLLLPTRWILLSVRAVVR